MIFIGFLIDVGTRDESKETSGSLLALRNTYLQPLLNGLYGERSFSNLVPIVLNKFLVTSMFKYVKIGFANAWRTGLSKDVLKTFFLV